MQIEERHIKRSELVGGKPSLQPENQYMSRVFVACEYCPVCGKYTETIVRGEGIGELLKGQSCNH